MQVSLTLFVFFWGGGEGGWQKLEQKQHVLIKKVIRDAVSWSKNDTSFCTDDSSYELDECFPLDFWKQGSKQKNQRSDLSQSKGRH